MTSVPNASDLIDGVIAFLRDEVSTSVDARLAFQGRVAANALLIARRDFMLGEAKDRAAVARLQALLTTAGERETLDRDLCSQIAEGRIHAETTGLLEHLWFTTLDALSIDQPTYATYLRVLAEGLRPNSGGSGSDGGETT